MKSVLLDQLWFSPLVVFNCIVAIILLVAGLLLLTPNIQEILR